MNYKLKIDRFSNMTDQTRYIGTSVAMGIPANFVQENFFDQANTTKDIPLLPLFNNYMDNNFGFYTLEFEYYSICGEFMERMYVEYATEPSPYFYWDNNGVVVATSTDINNPSTSCESAPELKSDGALSTGVINNYYAEVFDITNNYYVGRTQLKITTDWYNVDFDLPFDMYFYSGNFSDVAYFHNNPSHLYKTTINVGTICGVVEYDYYIINGDASCKKGGETLDEYLERHNIELITQVNLFPNPVENDLFIDVFTMENGSDFDLSIFNVNGQTVHKELLNVETNVLKSKIDVSNLERGIYFVNIKNKTFAKTLKITIK